LEDHAQDLAATIAFWAFFSIFPLLIGILALTGYFLESAELQTRIMDGLGDLLPGSSVLVQNSIETVMRHRGSLSWIGIIGLLWSASKGFGAIARVVNRALGTERNHFFLYVWARRFFMAAAVTILIIASLALIVAIEVELTTKAKALGGIDIPPIPGRALTFVLVFLNFSLIYRLAPYVKVRWRQVLPGALLGAVLFELGRSAFTIYLARVANFEEIYGPLASIIVLLLWLYVSSVILVFGAEYNIVRADARPRSPDGAQS